MKLFIEMAIGDAMGAGFEYKPRAFVEAHNDLSRYLPHGLQPDQTKVGLYTDDTQMSIAVSTRLVVSRARTFGMVVKEVNDPYSPITKSEWAFAFYTVYKKDPRIGYSQKFQALLDEVQSADELRARVNPNSNKCGAAMRALPCGFLRDPGMVCRVAHDQAILTHDTQEGIASARAVGLMAWFFRNRHKLGKNKTNLPNLLKAWVTGGSNPWVEKPHPISVFDWTQPYHGGPVDGTGYQTVLAALDALLKHDNLADILKQCIAYTGDVDSVAAIALGAASLCPEEFKSNLPTHLYRDLEPTPFGLNYLQNAEKALLNAAAEYA